MLLQFEIIGEVFVAMLLGGAIGFERESADKPAGLRTHMLVAGSAALLTGLGRILVMQFDANNNLISADPIRIIEAVITGITFLGAGTIIRQRQGKEVEGLTTAASLLLVGAVGISVALNQFILSIGITVMMLLALRGLKYGEKSREKS